MSEPTSKSKAAKIFKGILAIAVVYVGSYAILSVKGEWTYASTGTRRFTTIGLSIGDVQRWSPAIARWERYQTLDGSTSSRGNSAGYFYSPLIALDRAFVHPDHMLFESKNATTTKSVG